jgi:hypothetical protein
MALEIHTIHCTALTNSILLQVLGIQLADRFPAQVLLTLKVILVAKSKGRLKAAISSSLTGEVIHSFLLAYTPWTTIKQHISRILFDSPSCAGHCQWS